jgi:hypothetical protein
MYRRTAVRTMIGASALGLAGCLSGLPRDDSNGDGPPPVPSNRPDAVYYPSHVEGMQMIGMAKPWGARAAFSVSFPHRFWLVTGDRREQVTIKAGDAVHLMGSLWDPGWGVAIPAGSVDATITRNGETVDDRSLWPMLSQNMGMHFGDNVPLPKNDTYSVEVSIAPVGARRTGAYRERFADSATTTVELPFPEGALDDVMYRRLEDSAGERGAVSPMQMEMMTVPQVPPAADLPGETLGEMSAADIGIVVKALDAPPEGVDAEGAYLAVSLRTPYNRYPLPLASVTATVEAGGETTFDDTLRGTLDPDLHFHYGAAINGIDGADSLRLRIGTPQLARHEGYETAFFPTEPVTLSL